jgi:dephospho-CoA kinase
MPNNNIIIGIVGEIASGKGTAAEYIKEKYAGTIFKFSTVMRDVLSRLYLPQTRENLQMISLALRQTFGQDLFAKTMARDAAASTSEVTIIDGIRRPSDISELAKLSSFHLITIAADEKTRYERVKERNENANDAEKTWEQFQKESMADTEVTIRTIAPAAEFTIENNNDRETLYQAIDAVIAKIKSLPA